ncbi:hypothetical protein QO002_005546 [Pararhizobium capsulatum DSM 1112]|uniref:Uncharacterized protein n=1 Tax=Pararhizobium capsulatum DSM 1112 TaxID=1121113 RepID=A0ABU0BYJ8_9HYPH|nr:hypothetical protein [Pararhizobium capsulatum DSM 1112]
MLDTPSPRDKPTVGVSICTQGGIWIASIVCKRNFRCTLTAAAALNRNHTAHIQLYCAAVVVA